MSSWLDRLFPLRSCPNKRRQKNSNSRRWRTLCIEQCEDRALLSIARAVVDLSFTGTRQSDINASSIPDTNGSVGPAHVAELLNNSYAVYNKADGSLISRVSHDTFWNTALAAGGGGTTANAADPRIIYDHGSQRWFASAMDRLINPGRKMLVGVSNSSDPTQGWKAFLVDPDPTNLYVPDFPTLGVDADGVYIQTVMSDYGPDGISPTPQFPSTTISIPKADLVAATPTVSRATIFAVLDQNVQTNPLGWMFPVIDFGPSDGRAPMFEAARSGFLRSDILNAAGPGAATLANRVGGSFATPTPAEPPAATQPGTATLIETGASFLRSGVYQVNNTAWFTYCVDSGGRSAVSWVKINLANNAVLQQGLITDPNLHLYYPSIAVNSLGDAVIGFTGSSSTQSPSAYAVVGETNAGVTTFGALKLLIAGTGNFLAGFTGPVRWGDYSATALDPSDSSVFWTVQEFVSSNSVWGIQISKIDVDPTFQVSAFTPTNTGFVIDFNQVLDASQLNLYDTEGNGIGPIDVVLQPAAAGSQPVRGSLIVDSNQQRITFVATTGTLAPGDYTLTLRSATDGFRNSLQQLLDGDKDGSPGANYVRHFNVATPPTNAVIISLPNVARGPQQPVNLPAAGTSGLPISFSDGSGLTSATFQLLYDPTLLTITAAAVAPGLPAGSSVTLTPTSPGVATIAFTSPTALPPGTTRFVDLTAAVPTGAPYRNKHVLDIANIALSGGKVGVDDDAVHVSAYFGDANGSGAYTSQDASRISRLGVGLDSGLEPFQLLDPIIVSDLNLSGTMSSSDASLSLRAAVGLVVGEIPPLPSPAVSLLQGGPDPKLSIPADLVAAPGDNLRIPMHIDSIVDLTGDGVESADLVIFYDPSVLQVKGVALGSLLTAKGTGWFIGSRIDELAGRIDISLAGTRPLEGYFDGELVTIEALVQATAVNGASAINLAASGRTPNRATQLNDGYLTLIPAPTNAANDVGVDGLVTIRAAEPNPDLASARMVAGTLIIGGGISGERIYASPLATGEVRVRTQTRLLGTFPAPQRVLWNSMSDANVAYFSPQLPTPTRLDARPGPRPLQEHDYALIQLLNESLTPKRR